MEAGQGVGVITRASGIAPHPYASMYLLSYEVLWTKMHKDASASRRPILGTSLPHGGHKKRRCAAHHPSRYWSFDRTGTRRASVGGKARASRSLRHRSIVGRRRTEGFALATRAARCSLRSHSPLLPWRRSYRYKFGVGGGRQRSVPDRPGLASLDTRPIAGPFLRSVQVAGYKSVADVAPGRTRSLRSLRSFKSLPSIQRIVPVAPQP